ncbi:hypothetical protein DQ04_01441040 [Trypanosoma grayi]|uniref:hypothetical protein n=1 Tax=Trypanosoma grayi TaxID=71804 RepID=UPI0004F41A97|nr:hypothetical protein DQ04_01441040 [Trypanosoma grayi]KEG12758.1 hypothetical protein DQ04_01441040 [Trypanosoma grayi]
MRSSCPEDAGAPVEEPAFTSILASCEARLFALREQTAVLEGLLLTEAKRRTEHDNQLQKYIDDAARIMEHRIKEELNARMMSLQTTVEQLSAKATKLTGELRLEREKNIRLTQELQTFVVEGIGELQAALRSECVEREDRDRLLRAKLTETTTEFLSKMAEEEERWKKLFEAKRENADSKNESSIRESGKHYDEPISILSGKTS